MTLKTSKQANAHSHGFSAATCDGCGKAEELGGDPLIELRVGLLPGAGATEFVPPTPTDDALHFHGDCLDAAKVKAWLRDYGRDLVAARKQNDERRTARKRQEAEMEAERERIVREAEEADRENERRQANRPTPPFDRNGE